MGDYLYSRSISALAALGDVDHIAVLSRAANEMSVGELRQLASCDALDFGENDYERLISSKTASLMSAACELGAAAGAAEYREPLAHYGHALGMAFQIADDLLDYTQSEAMVGKPTGQDLREHKVTLPLIAAMRSMSRQEQARVRDFFASPTPTDDGVAEISDLVHRHGGLEYAHDRAEQFGARAGEALLALPDGDATQALHGAIAYVTERTR